MKVKQKLLDEINDDLPEEEIQEKDVIKFDNSVSVDKNNGKKKEKKNIEEDDGFIDDDAVD